MRQIQRYNFKVIQGQGQGHRAFKLTKIAIFKFYLLRHFCSQVEFDYCIRYYGIISEFCRVKFVNFRPVHVLRATKLHFVICPCVPPFTIRLDEAIWIIVIWIEVDEVNWKIWFSRWFKVKVKVTKPLNALLFIGYVYKTPAKMAPLPHRSNFLMKH